MKTNAAKDCTKQCVNIEEQGWMDALCLTGSSIHKRSEMPIEAGRIVPEGCMSRLRHVNFRIRQEVVMIKRAREQRLTVSL